MLPGIVAVHCGAGVHSQRFYSEYNKISKQASLSGVQVLRNGGSALDAVKEAVIVLENHPRPNCGYGSNLTLSGQVENDASIMSGKNLLYGGCGAVKRIKNPIELAYCLCKDQTKDNTLGLIPPSLLVGPGAHSYAKKMGLKMVDNGSLISKNSQKQHKKFLKLYEECGNMTTGDGTSFDTVGAVCMDKNGDFAAACSSGGILLKWPGRIGQGALYASGTWADSFDKENEPSVAVCTSGVGEYLVRTQLAKEIAVDVKNNYCPTMSLHNSITKKFIKSIFLRNVEEKLCGALVLRRNESEVSLTWGQSTKTMSLGYMRTDSKKPTALISELPIGSTVGQTVNIGGYHFYIEPR